MRTHLRLADALDPLRRAVGTEGAESFDFGFDVVDDDVEVHPVLAGLGFRARPVARGAA